MLPEEDLCLLKGDDFYLFQIVGCSVVTDMGEKVGRVKDVIFVKDNDLLVIEKDNREVLIPFVRTICSEVNIKKREIVISPPEGLLEWNEI